MVRRRTSFRETYTNNNEFRYSLGILVGTLPAAIVGLTLKDFIEGLFQSVASVLAALCVTGIFLFGTFFVKAGERRIGALNSFIVGLAQALAITPGISRAGATISTALFLRIRREDAGEFSFLLSLPAVLGATILALKDSLECGFASVPFHIAAVGVLVSWMIGWISLVFLMRIVKHGKIGYFGFYCIAVACIGAFVLWF
jgi:undecaprenyl-diphosphatase